MIVVIEDGIIKSAKIIGGCAGNTTAVTRLVEGMRIDDAIAKLKGNHRRCIYKESRRNKKNSKCL